MKNQGFLGKKSAYFLIITLLALSMPSGTSRAQALDPIVNPSFEDAGTTADQALDWQQIGFGDGYLRVATARTGAWGISLTREDTAGFAGAYQRLDFQQTSPNPVSLGAYVKGENIVNSDGGYFGASLYSEIHLMDGTIRYWNTVANLGTFDWRAIGFNTGTVLAPGELIDYIFVIPFLGLASGTAYFDDISVTEQTAVAPAVTLMFDDGETTTFTEGKKLMDRYGYKGSAAVPSSVVGTAGHMTAAQLLALQTGGWEIVSHSVDHVDLTTLTETQVDTQLSASKTALEALGLTVKNFALPFGAYNAQIQANAALYYRSSRPFETGFNPQGVDPFQVKIQGVVNTTTVAQVKAWLDEAKAQNRWLVLVFHSITRRGDDVYHTSPAKFSNILKAVQTSAVPVLTYDQGLTAFGVTP